MGPTRDGRLAEECYMRVTRFGFEAMIDAPARTPEDFRALLDRVVVKWNVEHQDIPHMIMSICSGLTLVAPPAMRLIMVRFACEPLNPHAIDNLDGQAQCGVAYAIGQVGREFERLVRPMIGVRIDSTSFEKIIEVEHP